MKSVIKIFLGVLIFKGLSFPVDCLFNDLVHFASSGVNDTISFLSKEINDILKLDTSSLIKLRPEVFLKAVTQICEHPNNVNLTKTISSVQNVGLFLMDYTNNKSFTIDKVNDMLNYPTFNKSNPVVVLVTDFFSKLDNTKNTALEAVYGGYHCRGNTNFIHFNSADYIPNLCFWSAANTKILGEFLAEFIIKLTSVIPIKNIHLIGHSLGAQIGGEAGRHFERSTGKLLPRITGLDPVRHCFTNGDSLNCIGKGDAEFVDIIHTNNDGLGIRMPIGDIDFYPNGVVLKQHGLNLIESHSYSYRLYGESVMPGAEHTFLAKKCDSLSSWSRGLCKGPDVTMGYAASPTTKGNFILKTSTVTPFGSIRSLTCPKLEISLTTTTTNTPTTTTSTSLLGKVINFFG